MFCFCCSWHVIGIIAKDFYLGQFISFPRTLTNPTHIFLPACLTKDLPTISDARAARWHLRSLRLQMFELNLEPAFSRLLSHTNALVSSLSCTGCFGLSRSSFVPNSAYKVSIRSRNVSQGANTNDLDLAISLHR